MEPTPADRQRKRRKQDEEEASSPAVRSAEKAIQNENMAPKVSRPGQARCFGSPGRAVTSGGARRELDGTAATGNFSRCHKPSMISPSATPLWPTHHGGADIQLRRVLAHTVRDSSGAVRIAEENWLRHDQ